MKTAFYPKLAASAIRKNKRLYFPYFLAGTVMATIYYIISYLSTSEMLGEMRGGRSLQSTLAFGTVVIAIFSLIFLFYSNSFLIRRRNKEFGLYNILGMDKRNLGLVMLWENLISAIISVAGGLIFGIALSKLFELLMINIAKQETDFTLRVDAVSAAKTVGIFMGIYVILFLNSSLRVHLTKPLELLRSDRSGEKPPKANPLIALLGVIILGAAYFIAVSVEDPLAAMVWFVVAVIMVIIATYLIFIAGSVALCRILQKNRHYYYKPNHFVSVSSMAYRMKRNGAGLASICILLTMVLVMLSSVISLYAGAEDSLSYMYPEEIYLRMEIPDYGHFNEGSFGEMHRQLCQKVPDQKNTVEYGYAEIPGFYTGDGITSTAGTGITGDNYVYVQIMTLKDYNLITGSRETLEENECLLYCNDIDFNGSSFSFFGDIPITVKAITDKTYISGYNAIQRPNLIVIISDDIDSLVAQIMRQGEEKDSFNMRFSWYCGFDIDGDAESQISAYEAIRHGMDDIAAFDYGDEGYSYSIGCEEVDRADFYGTYGGLLLVGIMLSIVFLFSAVLIIYYKQVSEGFEDRKRFEVMQKVGMTDKDIRKSVNSQMLTVFFLPIAFAGIHLAFAFPMLNKILLLFGFRNTALMVAVTASVFIVFALVYALVYRITSNEYCKIVSENNE